MSKSVSEVSTLSTIETIEDLREHLQWAIELEHATIPPYLCALYSLDPKQNSDASELIAGIFVEEMLHLALAANVLNAVGGRPVIDSPSLLLPYPRVMPHSDGSLVLDLAPFDTQSLEAFLLLERPAEATAVAEADRYETIGQFYTAIEDGLQRLCERFGEQAVFSGDPARQVRSVHFQHSAAAMIGVVDLATALDALAEIIDQGEGIGRQDIWDGDATVLHPDRSEVAHYFRLEELKFGRCYQPGDTPQSGPTGDSVSVDFDAVLPMRRNPRLNDHPANDPIRIAQEKFNATYCTMLGQLDQVFNGSPERLPESVRAMFSLKAQAVALMQMLDGDANVAGPTFDFVPPELRH